MLCFLETLRSVPHKLMVVLLELTEREDNLTIVHGGRMLLYPLWTAFVSECGEEGLHAAPSSRE